MRLARAITLVLLGASSASAQAPAEGLYHLVRREPVERGARITSPRVIVAAIDNGNTRFQVWARYRRRGECGQIALVLGGRTLVNESWGSSSDTCSGSFQVAPDVASAAAALFGVPRQDRSPIGEQVTGTFSPSQRTYRAGEPIEIVLAMESPPGAPAIGWQRGGRNRGPRDNQFSFVILRDGQPLPPIEAMDFGGLSGRERLDPGGRAEVRAPLASWGDVSRPGRYEVRCAYETTFTPNGVDPFSDDDRNRGRLWDRRFEGTVRFEVR